MQLNDPEAFAHGFLEEFMRSGFGSMPKRDMEIMVLHLLVRDGQYDLPSDLFKACRELKLTETRVRSLYQSLQLKYALYDETEAKRRFAELLEQGLIESKNGRLTFIVRDPLLRQYFEEWVASLGRFADSSFNKNLVVVSTETFRDVVTRLAVGDFDEIRQCFHGELVVFEASQDKKSLARLFTEELVKSLGKETGSVTIHGLAAMLKMLLIGLM